MDEYEGIARKENYFVVRDLHELCVTILKNGLPFANGMKPIVSSVQSSHFVCEYDGLTMHAAIGRFTAPLEALAERQASAGLEVSAVIERTERRLVEGFQKKPVTTGMIQSGPNDVQYTVAYGLEKAAVIAFIERLDGLFIPRSPEQGFMNFADHMFRAGLLTTYKECADTAEFLGMDAKLLFSFHDYRRFLVASMRLPKEEARKKAAEEFHIPPVYLRL